MGRVVLSKNKIGKEIILILCFLFLFLFYPFVFNRMIGLQNENIVLIVFLIFSSAFFLKYPYLKKTIPPLLTKCVLIQSIFWLGYFFIHRDSSYITRLLMIILSILVIHLLIKKGTLFKFVSYYNSIICIMAILGFPIFFIYALGLISPIAEFANIDGRSIYFFGTTCSNSITAGICRVAGFFDEPGAFAFWGIIALLFNKLYFKNRVIEYCLIIGLLTTLSAAYFVQLLMYILLFYGGKLKNLLIMVLILGTIGVITYKKLGDNAQLAYMTIERFEGGQIRSSRGEMTKNTKVIFKSHPIFGVGAKKLQETGYFDDNPYEIPAKDGIIGLIVTYLPLLAIAIRYGRKHTDLLFAIIILAAGYLQRPFHINVLHYLILYLFVTLAYYSYGRQQVNI